MKYAVIRSGGKQYKVGEGDEILVDKLNLKNGDDYLFQEILLIKDGEKLKLGNPYLEGEKVSGKVIDQIKGEKIIIAKFKAKVRFRRKTGFRPLYTKIRIESISGDAVSSEKKATAKKKTSKLPPKKDKTSPREKKS